MTPYATRVIENDVQERLTKALESCLPEDGMALILSDRHQCCWTSDPVVCDPLIENISAIQDMIVRINDGDEPALARVGDAFVVGVPLWTPCCDYGHAMLVLSNVDNAALVQNWPLVECVLNQIQCIAGLIEMQDDSVSLSSQRRGDLG